MFTRSAVCAKTRMLKGSSMSSKVDFVPGKTMNLKRTQWIGRKIFGS